MRHLLFALAFALLSTSVTAQTLTAAEIESAIQAGLAGKRLNSNCSATSALMDFTAENGGFEVLIEGPVGRIMRLAAEAKKKYQPFTAESVTPEMLEPNLFLIAAPYGPRFTSGAWHRTPAAEHVVLKRKGAKGEDPADVLQPTAHTLEPTSWTNAMGGKWDGQGITASFPLAAFKAMPGDEIDIVIITPVGERRCKIGKKDRAALR